MTELPEDHLEGNNTQIPESDILPIITTKSSVDLYRSKLAKLFQLINENFQGADLTICFFIAALNSYRASRCLRPFPPAFLNKESNIKDFKSLRLVCDNIPFLREIVRDPKKCPPEVLDLLLWLFLEKGQPTLKKVPLENISWPSTVSPKLKPHYSFEVCYQKKFEETWLKRKHDRDIILGYHGSTIDNFYSILRVGLQQHFSVDKEVLFGNGIYLSSELSISTNYAPFGKTWHRSSLGTKHSIIAICEIINDEEKVKCKDSKNKKRAQNLNSYGEIPQEYFVVTDSDMVRVKYLLVYKENNVSTVKSFMTKNIFFVMLVLYFCMLVMIGVFNGRYWQKYLNYFKWASTKRL